VLQELLVRADQRGYVTFEDVLESLDEGGDDVTALEALLYELDELGIVPNAMIDVSDGIASELMHLCTRSGTGAVVYEDKLPIDGVTFNTAAEFNIDPVTCALNGGEDYELLFTIDPKDVDKIKFLPDIYIAGEITDAKDGMKLHTKGGNIHDLRAQGWTHFG